MIGMDRHTGAALSGVEHLRQSIADILTTPVGSRPPRPPVPPVPPVPPGRAARAMGLIGKAGKAVPGAALFEGVLRAADTYQNAETKDEKAEGYGAAAGNMAGALAGAAAGAAIGSVVPILGTAVGGLIGGILGSMGGESIGGSLGKSWFGSDDEKPAEPPKPEAKAAGEPLAPVVKPVSYDPADPDSKDPFLLPHVANKPRFPGADLVRPDSLPPPTASPAPVVKPVSYDPDDPDSKNPFLLSHFANKPCFPGADLVRPKSLPPEGSLGASASRDLPGAMNMGDVVRSFAATAPAGPLAMPPKAEPVLKVEPPKIDQKIDVNAALSITVQGDVKDPAALARELQPHLQRQIEQINQQMSSRNLYDQPHL